MGFVLKKWYSVTEEGAPAWYVYTIVNCPVPGCEKRINIGSFKKFDEAKRAAKEFLKKHKDIDEVFLEKIVSGYIIEREK